MIQMIMIMRAVKADMIPVSFMIRAASMIAVSMRNFNYGWLMISVTAVMIPVSIIMTAVTTIMIPVSMIMMAATAIIIIVIMTMAAVTAIMILVSMIIIAATAVMIPVSVRGRVLMEMVGSIMILVTMPVTNYLDCREGYHD